MELKKLRENKVPEPEVAASTRHPALAGGAYPSYGPAKLFWHQLLFELKKNYVYILLAVIFFSMVQILPFVLSFIDPAEMAKEGFSGASNANFLRFMQNGFMSPFIIVAVFFLLYNIFSPVCDKNACDFWYSLPLKSYVLNGARITAALLCQLIPLLIHALVLRLYFGAGPSVYEMDKNTGFLTPWSSYAPFFRAWILAILSFTVFALLMYALAGKISEGLSLHLAISLLSLIFLHSPLFFTAAKLSSNHYLNSCYQEGGILYYLIRIFAPFLQMFGATEANSMLSLFYLPCIIIAALYALSKRPSEIAEQGLVIHGKHKVLHHSLLFLSSYVLALSFDKFIEEVFSLPFVGIVIGGVFGYAAYIYTFGGKFKNILEKSNVIYALAGLLAYPAMEYFITRILPGLLSKTAVAIPRYGFGLTCLSAAL